MNRKDAEKMADDIFDMIDRNHPRGLIKSELVDLLAKYDGPTVEAPHNLDAWITLEAALSEVEIKTPDLCGND